jgi:hypothetical protein
MKTENTGRGAVPPPSSENLTEAELVAAIYKTQDGKSYFEGTFGLAGVSGKVITPQ